MDSQAHKFVKSTIKSDHELWLAIARHIVIYMQKDGISNHFLQSVLIVMYFEFWFKDVAIEC